MDAADLERIRAGVRDPVRGSDGRAAQEDARNSRRGFVSRNRRHVDRALRAGGPVAFTIRGPVQLDRVAGDARLRRHLRPVRDSRDEADGRCREGARSFAGSGKVNPRRFKPAIAAALVTLAGCNRDYPMTTMGPKSDLGQAMYRLMLEVTGWDLLILAIVTVAF